MSSELSGCCKDCGETITYSWGAWRHDSNGSMHKDGHQALPPPPKTGK